MELLQKKKKIVGAAIFILAISVLLLIRFSAFGEEPTFERVMLQTAAELNKTCPQKVDEDTDLDSASIHPNKTFRYNYTIRLEKDSIEPEMYALSVKPLMLENVKTNIDLQFFKDNGVTFEYYFRDVNGALVTRIDIGPDEYVSSKELPNQ